MPLAWQAAASAAMRENQGDSLGILDSRRLPPQPQLKLGSWQRIRHSQVPRTSSLLPAPGPQSPPAAVTLQGYVARSVPVWDILPKGLLRPQGATASLSVRRDVGRMHPHRHPTAASYVSTSHISPTSIAGKWSLRKPSPKHWDAAGTGWCSSTNASLFPSCRCPWLRQVFRSWVVLAAAWDLAPRVRLFCEQLSFPSEMRFQSIWLGGKPQKVRDRGNP